MNAWKAASLVGKYATFSYNNSNSQYEGIVKSVFDEKWNDNIMVELDNGDVFPLYGSILEISLHKDES